MREILQTYVAARQRIESPEENNLSIVSSSGLGMAWEDECTSIIYLAALV